MPVRHQLLPFFKNIDWLSLSVGRTFAQTFRASGSEGVPIRSAKGEREAVSPTRRAILAEREDIHRDFERAAQLGYVPDAFVGLLYSNHCDEQAEAQREFDALEQALSGHLLRLDALFPASPPPEPERPRGRVFGRIGDLLKDGGPQAPNTRH